VSGRVLVLGAAGRLGRAAAVAFGDAGWQVVGVVRPGMAAQMPAGTTAIERDALDAAGLAQAARGCDVVLHALNVSYPLWPQLALPLAQAAIGAAESAGATLLFPGNLYNHGSPPPACIDEATPMRPTSRKGRLRVLIEDRLAEAAERGLRAIVIRAGDFFGSGSASWFDLVVVKDIARGRLNYPGPIDLTHAWAYLPDLAATMARLAAVRAELAPFDTFGFAGHALTGRELTTAIARAYHRGLVVKRMSWWLIHALRRFVPLSRELSEVAYLWSEPHRIDDSKLRAAIGEVPHTTLDVAVARALEDLRATR
jgi:nucleoside-diphosphate-sugar epimerase